MGDWSVTKVQAQKAAQQIYVSGTKLKQYAANYDAVRNDLLKSWEGSHKESFATETQNGFDQSAEALASALLKLADMVQETTKQMVQKDATAANVISGK